MASMRAVCENIIAALMTGETPVVDSADIACFAPAAIAGNPNIDESTLPAILASLDKSDIPTFERACAAIDKGELAWLGFKIVTNAELATSNIDNAVTKKYGDVGSADGQPLVFFCSDAKEIVASREFSPRDLFQMKDATRGPSMHCEQFEGLTWANVPLFDAVRVWLLGATDCASEVAALARHVGFEVIAVDNDSAYLNEERFPDAKCILIDDFSKLDELHAAPADYVCVLTRGHMADPEGCIWAVKNKVHYVGMMGCAGKNNTVYGLCKEAGVTDEQWDAIKRPIGLSFGAKTPAELAIAIVGELIDVRYKERYSEEARLRHEKGLGRI